MKPSEPELIAHILDDNHEAYGQLIDRHKQGVYRHCFRIVHDEDTAEDLAQEAFIHAYVHLDQYDDHYAFSASLYKIATNLAQLDLKLWVRLIFLLPICNSSYDKMNIKPLN